ncbi:LacI family transcriptional regulator [Deinococcus indicus]|uniref:LacI family transcriptional regulator n=1 Tax=Deinococcus indicus TaxID=223556 RepID=A0A246BDS4_9DEIO|nr:LacI family DNA-binding transcriptional regulator [Deinococcus indicus]OWL93254.1 LacI family transcriptional regulator [Deinococcus indicus]GHG33353.1 LacI family transcriptional regulator [Deinococcus indicus]
MTAPVTIADVARLAGVSAVTVSKTLNNTGRISEQTRARVIQAARDLGYVANPAARRLRGARTNLVGMVVPELVSPYFAEVARAAAEAASSAGLDLGVFTTSRDPARERERVAALSGGLADGLILVVPTDDPQHLDVLQRSRTPIVLISHFGTPTDLPNVRADSYHGAHAATTHLLDLGHRRVGFIAGADGSSQAHERLRAYRDATGERGLLDPDLIRPGNFTQRRGFEAARELLDLPDPPTAIFAASDATAFGAMDAVKDRGLRVPQDISVVGFDDIAAASQSHPALTTVRHPIHDMSDSALRLLSGALAGEAVRGTVLDYPSELVVRETTAPPRSS